MSSRQIDRTCGVEGRKLPLILRGTTFMCFEGWTIPSYKAVFVRRVSVSVWTDYRCLCSRALDVPYVFGIVQLFPSHAEMGGAEIQLMSTAIFPSIPLWKCASSGKQKCTRRGKQKTFCIFRSASITNSADCKMKNFLWAIYHRNALRWLQGFFPPKLGTLHKGGSIKFALANTHTQTHVHTWRAKKNLVQEDYGAVVYCGAHL